MIVSYEVRVTGASRVDTGFDWPEERLLVAQVHPMVRPARTRPRCPGHMWKCIYRSHTYRQGKKRVNFVLFTFH
jgi:hypothetical protein